MNLHSLEHVNQVVEEGKVAELISSYEQKFDGQVNQIADTICSHLTNCHLILTSGPSSSGKTTFSLKLCNVLRQKGMEALVISLDNFFQERNKIPRNELNELDYESVHALDLPLIEDCFKQLFSTGKAMFPRFDFLTGKQILNRYKMNLKENTVIVVEGIHALNDHILERMPVPGCQKIYISLLSNMEKEDGTKFLKKQDIRLLRRIVRDYKYRGSSLENTLNMWGRVLYGDYKYVIPTKDRADIHIDTYFPYDVGIIKPFVSQHLESVTPEMPYYERICEIIEKLALVKEIDEKLLPPSALIREFIGESIYYK